MQKEHNRVGRDILEQPNLTIISLKIKFVFKEHTDSDGNGTVSRHVGQVSSTLLDDLSNKTLKQPSQNV